MKLSFKDTLTRRESEIVPSRNRVLQMYVCGPTVYSSSHVGHARTYILFDIVKRYLKFQGARVNHVQNITDFEDKITKAATDEGISWKELSEREAVRYQRLMRILNIKEPDVRPFSSHYVKKMIMNIRTLERRGFTYSRKGSVYFDTSSVPWGKNFSAEDMLTAHAVPEPGMKALPEANDPRDFVLWRPSHPPAPVWDSPWGRGAPGWHIECFAMASQNMILPMDLHGGGLDLIFPHHYAENLISMAMRGHLISRHFIHQSFVTMGAKKMSKSTGNLVTIDDALSEVSPCGLRSYLLSRNYEERLEFSIFEAHQADRGWIDDADALGGLLSPGRGAGYPVGRLREGITEVVGAVGNNLSTDLALSRLHELASDIRRSGRYGVARGDRRETRRLLTSCEALLGLHIINDTC